MVDKASVELAGNGFKVDLTALEAAAGGIVDAISAMQAHRVEDLDCKPEAFGHDALAATTKDFCDRWERGVFNLLKDGEEVIGRLIDSVKIYRGIEDRIISSLETR